MKEDYRARRVLVVGLGRSGLAVCRLLAPAAARVVAADQRPREELPAEVASLEPMGVSLVTGSHPPELVDEADLVVLSPGVPTTLPLVERARAREIPIWGELEVGFREVEGMVLAVTGTKGKSTTATLLQSMLQATGREVRLAGNIGSPLVQELEGASKETTFVLEVSSFQLETIDRFRPHVAVLLDVSPDHLDWHPTFRDYLRAKERIFENQTEEDHAVVFGGNRWTVEMARRARPRKLYFDLECLEELTPHVHANGPWIVMHEDRTKTPLASLAELQVPGRHNRLNALAASAAAALVGASGADVGYALEHFHGLPHALEKVADIDGVRYFNDSKATNVQAVRAALESFDAPILLLLGGRLKGGDLGELRDHVARKVKRVLAIGESRDRIAGAFSDLVPVEICRSLESAVKRAHRRARPGDVVLLSPAGSSFDMFRDYRERGERFRAIVERLAAGE
ncbi:MAG TPA: UDP-N-acetylmuramoyl-L-alanine--D-glutamate ligase [Vicinamibacteria bacterium]|nr:UDP-N-acetylmuramoyl-L-alanine--D-glutamate ligase [Vicinamibacteria bacterium]